MENKKIKWLVYTFFIGLIPVISRMFAWGITKTGTLEFLSATDFISFGLVLHISNINEIEHLEQVDQSWKTTQNGSAIFFISIYSVLFAVSLIGDRLVEKAAMLYCSIALAFVSSALSYSVYHYLTRSQRAP